ncbi:ABC transporter family substrate-binding protein [Aeromicrobium sp.]|uniref:ABC transporter family substrate-binding protein n=1 Tax=Aeromicrobium sp. TaxID=1871063 RepID=UPI0030C63149
MVHPTMRRHAARAASLLLAGSLVLSGCSLLPGGEKEKPTARPTTTTKSPARTGTSWQAEARDKVRQGGTLRLGATVIPRNFNPQHPDGVSTEAGRILAPTIGGAVRVTADGDWRVDPDYAESVKVTDKDPLTVQVRLNPKAVWQGGTSITAKDMVAYWQAMNGSDDDFEVASSAGFDDITEVRPGKSRFTYSVIFKTRDAEWPLYVYPRLPAKVTSSPKLFNSGFRTRAISSNGPFVVSSIDSTKGMVTQKPNPRWWGERPKLSTITWQAASPDVLVKGYAEGELDAVDLEAGTYAVGKAAKSGAVQRAPGVEWSQVTLNGGRGPLKDVDVRRAVAHALDRSAVGKQSSGPLGAPASPLGSVILVPGQRGYVDSSAAVAYDQQRADKLLTKAGWTKGSDGIRTRKGKRLKLTMPSPAKTPANTARSKLIVSQLRKVGIDVRVRTVPARKFFSRYVIALDFDLVNFVRRGSAFPLGAAEALFYPVDSAQNFTGLGEERIGDGWDVAKGTLNDKLRFKRIAKLDEWLFEDVAVVPLAVTPLVVAVRTGLVNYGAAQFEQPDWTRVGFMTKK